TPMPTAFSEKENMRYPRERKFSLQSTTAIPAIKPIAIRPEGPIQLFSKANFRKYETPIRTAAIPMRFSQCEPMRDSRSALPTVEIDVRRFWAARRTGAGVIRGALGICWAVVDTEPAVVGCAGGP